jgi:hypothetical protein
MHYCNAAISAARCFAHPDQFHHPQQGSSLLWVARHLARYRLLRLALVLLALLGPATQAHADGRWCINTDVIQFGNRVVGTSTNSTVTVTNCGDQPWSFTDVSVHTSTGPAFHVNTSCTTGLTLAPTQACTATIQFAPLVAGQTSGALWLRNTTNTPTQLLTFYGRGVDAQASTATLKFVPAAAVFPAQDIGKQSAAVNVELQNLGPAALTPSAIVMNGPEVYDFIGYPVTCQVGSPDSGRTIMPDRVVFHAAKSGNPTRKSRDRLAATRIPRNHANLGCGSSRRSSPRRGCCAPEAIPTIGTGGLALLALAIAILGWWGAASNRAEGHTPRLSWSVAARCEPLAAGSMVPDALKILRSELRRGVSRLARASSAATRVDRRVGRLAMGRRPNDDRIASRTRGVDGGTGARAKRLTPRRIVPIAVVRQHAHSCGLKMSPRADHHSAPGCA